MRLLVRVLFAALLWLPTIASPSVGRAQVGAYLPTQAEMDELAAEVRASMGIEATFETEEEEDAAALGFDGVAGYSLSYAGEGEKVLAFAFYAKVADSTTAAEAAFEQAGEKIRAREKSFEMVDSPPETAYGADRASDIRTSSPGPFGWERVLFLRLIRVGRVVALIDAGRMMDGSENDARLPSGLEIQQRAARMLTEKLLAARLD